MGTIHWIETTPSAPRPSNVSKKIHRALCVAGMAENGEIFMSAYLVAKEMLPVQLMAMHDGAALAMYDKNLYVPLSWIVKQADNDQQRDDYQYVESQIRKNYRELQIREAQEGGAA